MTEKIEDRNVEGVVPLISPRAVKARAAADGARRRRRSGDPAGDPRRAARPRPRPPARRRRAVLDPRPATPRSTTPRGSRASPRRTRDALVIVMRTYFEKPRTTVGWKGLINDPHLDGSCDIATGLRARAPHAARASTSSALPCGGELLDPITPQYIADLLSWAAIGARTTESQTHREMASGLSMPVGFKNGTDGGLQVALDAMISARHPHTLPRHRRRRRRPPSIHTVGNPDRHIVLRGGGGGPNYRPGRRRPRRRRWSQARASRVPSWSTARTATRARTTPASRSSAARSWRSSTPAAAPSWGSCSRATSQPGRQDWKPDATLRYGVSITDACIGWDETETLLGEIAAATRTKTAA